MAVIFWIFLIMFSIYLINPLFHFLVANVVLLLLLICYEALSFYSHKRLYFTKTSNRIDVGMILYTILTIIAVEFSNYFHPKLLSFIKILALFIIFYRGFIHLQVFDRIRHLINMIIGVTQSIISTLSIFAYVMLAFSVFMTQPVGGYKFSRSLKVAFGSIFGNFPEEEEKEVDGETIIETFDISLWILLVLLGVAISLILTNFLIAIMSSKYSELLLKQTILTLKG